MPTPRALLLLVTASSLVACQAPPARDSNSFYYASSQTAPTARTSSSTKVGATSATVPRGGYAPGSGPTSMPGDAGFVEQYRESGPFGSYSRTTRVQSSGGVESYQTIGNMPVYPGMAVPGYNPNQTYYGPRTSQQPVFVPGTGGAAGYYVDPNTGARINR